MKRTLLIVILVIALALAGCSKADNARIFEYGQPKLVISYGAECINQLFISEGRVEEGSSSWYFTDMRDPDLNPQEGGDLLIFDAPEDYQEIYKEADSRAEAVAELIEQVQEDGYVARMPTSCNSTEE